MQNFNTPMMKQYIQIKKQHQDCLLLYRMGDFYELFMEDAYIGAKILNITLTSRPKGKDGRIPMAGVPYHAIDAYLGKLVKAGFKVAICEQVSLPNKYGIVDREVVRIVTPGTVLDEKVLEKKTNNYIISITVESKSLSIATADVSTGYFSVQEMTFDNIAQLLKDELSRLSPAECILPESLYNDPQFLQILKTQKGLNIYCFPEWESFAAHAKKFLKKHFGVSTLASFGIEEKPLILQVSSALLGYLKQTQKTTVSHIKKITTLTNNEYVIVDRSTMINLELFSTLKEHDTRGSLLSVIDQTITAMGGRMLKQWMVKPLRQKEKLSKRLDMVEELIKKSEINYQVREYLKQVADIERILSRLSVGLGNARDLINLKLTLQTILTIKDGIKGMKSVLLTDLINKINSQSLKKIVLLIDKNIEDEPPIDLRGGGLIKMGVHKELDDLRQKVGKSKDWIVELEQQERERTGIGSLKVRFNRIFGFYIEISRANLHLIPKNYLRKQTLVNGERFITPALKAQEEIILTAEERSKELEYNLFLGVVSDILNNICLIQAAAQSMAILDCISSFAYLAEKEQYVKPKILDSGEIQIKDGRHPVVEKLLEDSQFVPNDVSLGTDNQKLILITGPNMAGKSVFIRQVALIVLMAQIGCFIPAKEAKISLVDRIFVRSGASDMITSGLSTFMVEMVETAQILHNATENSLIIMDEIGRGTSTYDGISIAWAVAEYLVSHSKIPPKTLFATHYHELQDLESQYAKSIKNYHMSVANEKGEPVFLYTLLPGGASHSFGVAVAKLAGVPEAVIKKAEAMLQTLEKRNLEPKEFIKQSQTPRIIDHLIHKELESLDILQMTPLDAMNKLAQLKEKLRLLETGSEKFIEMD